MSRRPKEKRAEHLKLSPSPAYPFAAIVGQDEMKLALILSVIAPSLGGVLLMGHRGTGKSTAVRSLAALLPPIRVVRGCAYLCDPEAGERLCAECRARTGGDGKLPSGRITTPLVDLPLGATEDRVCGSIDFGRALSEGVKAFEPGLLARANRGFLYVDEVNLLEDHLVDLLLDVAATGRNVVEREGISTEHPARFVLVGSGNPEEGELRPQLLDRFGLYCEVRTGDDLEERVEIVERREGFDADPAGFSRAWEGEQQRLRRRLVRARKNVGAVKVPRRVLRFVAGLCARLRVDGHRGELTVTRAARALAAFEGSGVATTEHVRRVAPMALRHRLRHDPLEQTPGGARVERTLEEMGDGADAETNNDGESRRANPPGDTTPQRTRPASGTTGDGNRADEKADKRQPGNSPTDSGGRDRQDAPPSAAHLPKEAEPSPVKQRPSARHSFSGRRHESNSRTIATHGKYTRAVAHQRTPARIALDATFRAAAPHQTLRRRAADAPLIKISAGDLRYKELRRKSGTLFILAVDTSGSMAANRIGQAKGALALLLRRAYVKRDRVALISFRERDAALLLPPSNSTARARNILNQLPVGGATPLAAGLMRALDVARRAAREGVGRIALLVFTDGRANVALRASAAGDESNRKRRIAGEIARVGEELRRAGVQSIVVDTRRSWTSGGEAQALAEALGGRRVFLPLDVSRASADDLAPAF